MGRWRENQQRSSGLALGHATPGGPAAYLKPGPRRALDNRSVIHNHMVVDNLTATFAALSDPTRRAILDRLKRGPATVGELASPFAITQQAVSKHLAYLQRARLIEKRRQGREQVCALRMAPIQQVATWATEFQKFWQDSFERMDTLLAQLETAGKQHGRKK